MTVADKPRREASTKKPTAAIKVKVDRAKLVGPQPTTTYIIGTRQDCPIQNVDVAGISFLRFSGGTPVFNSGDTANDGRDRGGKRWGVYVRLTDGQVERIVANIANKVVRIMKRPKRNTGRILTTDAPSYSPLPNDEPLAKFLYMHKAETVSAADAESGDYEPMLEE